MLFLTSGILGGGETEKSVAPYPPRPSSPHSKETRIYQDRKQQQTCCPLEHGGHLLLGQGVFYLQTVGCLSKEEVTEKRDRGRLQGGVSEHWPSSSGMAFSGMALWNKLWPRSCFGSTFAWPWASCQNLPLMGSVSRTCWWILYLMLNPMFWVSVPYVPLPTKQSPLDIPPLTCPKLMTHPLKCSIDLGGSLYSTTKTGTVNPIFLPIHI